MISRTSPVCAGGARARCVAVARARGQSGRSAGRQSPVSQSDGWARASGGWQLRARGLLAFGGRPRKRPPAPRLSGSRARTQPGPRRAAGVASAAPRGAGRLVNARAQRNRKRGHGLGSRGARATSDRKRAKEPAPEPAAPGSGRLGARPRRRAAAAPLASGARRLRHSRAAHDKRARRRASNLVNGLADAGGPRARINWWRPWLRSIGSDREP